VKSLQNRERIIRERTRTIHQGGHAKSGQGFEKRPERFRFQEDWAVDLSEGEISASRELGIQKTENKGNACIAVSRIAKAGSAWSWNVFSTFQNPGVQE
jgi:hypothetical protein